MSSLGSTSASLVKQLFYPRNSSQPWDLHFLITQDKSRLRRVFVKHHLAETVKLIKCLGDHLRETTE